MTLNIKSSNTYPVQVYGQKLNMGTIGSFFIILIILLTIIFALLKKTPVFSTFTEGAKEGLKSTFAIVPAIVGLIVSVTMFKESMAMDILVKLLTPMADCLNIPKDIIPLTLIKPLSGSGSLALVSSIFKDFGPDSFIGKLASVIMASTETTFYILTVYLASSKLKLTKKIIITLLLVNVFSFLISNVVTKLIF